MRLFKKKRKRNTYTVDGLINRMGLISGIIYSLANGWAYIWGGALKWDFTELCY